MTEKFVIKCPACSKNKTVAHNEGEGYCKRCQADLTALIRIQNATLRSWNKIIASLVAGDLKQAQATIKNIARLTPLSNSELLAWLLESIDIDSYNNKMETTNRQNPDGRTTSEL